MTEPILRILDLAQLAAEEEARLRALDLTTAAAALTDAVHALAVREAGRLDIPFLDPTYHGCDPAWRGVLFAASDLRAVLRREQVKGDA